MISTRQGIGALLSLFAVVAVAVFPYSGLCREKSGSQTVNDSPSGHSDLSRFYELTDTLPRFYFQDRWVVADDDQQLHALLNYDLRACGYCPSVVWQTRPSPDQLLIPPPLGEKEWIANFASLQDRNRVLSVDVVKPGRIELVVEISQPGMLVVTDPYRPGGRVTVSGKRERLSRVNYLQGGIWCSPGKHHIVMEPSAVLHRPPPSTVIYGLVSILTLVLSSWILCRLLKAGTLVEYSAFLFTFLTGQIIIGGIVLSELNLLGSIFHWCLFNATLFLCLLVAIIFSRSLQGRVFGAIAFPGVLSFFRKLFSGLTAGKKIALSLLLLTAAGLGLVNAAVIIGTAPSHWDSMVFHLARVGYWLQHNNFDYYEASTCFQVTHQKLKSILLLFVFLATGRNENLTQLVQFSAYWAAVFSIYGISRQLRLKRSAALFAALIFSLLTECLMQSNTPQSDMLLTAYLGSAIYLVLSYKNNRQKKFLLMAGIDIGLALGTKPPAFLALPGLSVIIFYLFYICKEPVSFKFRDGALLALVALLAFVIFALPTGYWENYRVFGHPLGPEALRKYHSFEGRGPRYIQINGTKNVFRYCSDFLSLDGFPPVPIVTQVQSLLKAAPLAVFTLAGIQLEAEEGEGTREGPFLFKKPPYSHADFSYWGIFGFAFIWPAVFLALLGIIKFPAGRVFAVAAILFLLMQAYSGPYEPNRGRYFIEAAVFTVPVAGYLFLSRNKLVRGYLLLVVILGCISAFTAVLFRYRSPVLTRESVFSQDRLGQVLRNGPVFQPPIRNFEELVPPDAVVAVCLNPNSFEYPLFGYKLTRTIIPLNSFWRGLRPVHANADYLLWAEDFDYVFSRNKSDIYLGKDWHLRKLK